MARRKREVKNELKEEASTPSTSSGKAGGKARATVNPAHLRLDEEHAFLANPSKDSAISLLDTVSPNESIAMPREGFRNYPPAMLHRMASETLQERSHIGELRNQRIARRASWSPQQKETARLFGTSGGMSLLSRVNHLSDPHLRVHQWDMIRGMMQEHPLGARPARPTENFPNMGLRGQESAAALASPSNEAVLEQSKTDPVIDPSIVMTPAERAAADLRVRQNEAMGLHPARNRMISPSLPAPSVGSAPTARDALHTGPVMSSFIGPTDSSKQSVMQATTPVPEGSHAARNLARFGQRSTRAFPQAPAPEADKEILSPWDLLAGGAGDDGDSMVTPVDPSELQDFSEDMQIGGSSGRRRGRTNFEDESNMGNNPLY
jgi:hypothetical protein